MAPESLRSIILTRVDGFLQETGMPETALGARAVRDTHFVRRLRGNKNIGLNTCQRVLDFISAETDRNRTGAAA